MCSLGQRLRTILIRQRHIQVRRLVRHRPVGLYRKRAPFRSDRTAEGQVVALNLLRALRRRKRTAAAERTASQPSLEAAAEPPQTGLRDDVDEERAGIVILGSESVACDMDGFDL